MDTKTTGKTQLLMDKELIKILLVEADSADRRIIERALAKCSWPVEFVIESAGSLSAAFECLGNNGYDIIVFDLGLPDSSGIETVQRIRETNPNLPIVVLTDITKRKKAEEKIKHAAKEWQRTFDSISDLVFIQDKDFTITKVNKAFADAISSKAEDTQSDRWY